ncbi:hypothetical protein G6F57_010141 [Rhizopus arrhizus]|uniref:MFS general substrate transporter n=1 Tax=Rhizopus oryzae TaxID=64495 RepID=A0A9P7BNV0_RHIOR|nr:hypothetical protein G6F23_008878 [Rhizopus arrhizus]KAG1413026.1 hypothetical protein G6F58_007708 [Rhizopus delemar]KAG0757642.1 hypothetical protein G6F24_010347 [Rhizopus arrhizus]KAG0784331.1 hypothetical protein G6F21_009974 [Rhizopus arrhizus]KAG0796698.1 hypothetical protein G6F22_004853 [Rhizopus arrhizus]
MGLKLPFRYSDPNFQVFLVGFICFCCPGMFNALNGMGGAGQADTKVTNDANTALAVTFTVCSLVGAPVFNIFGHRILLPAALAYVLYVGSYLTPNAGFTIATGAILGVGAGFLWTAQAGIMMSYPDEKDKGKAFSIFWMIFNLGATVGAAIPLGNNFNNTSSTISIGTYIGFMVIMGFGAFLSLALLPPSKVIRANGTPVSLHKFSNWRREAIEILALFCDWKMICLIPLFAGSNWFYTYQFQVYNGGGFFSLPARSLNNLVYWLCQIIGAAFFGWLLDLKWLGQRKTRAIIANTFVLCLLSASWIGAIFVQKKFTFESVKAEGFVHIDVHSPEYAGYIILYAVFGLVDSIYQGFIYWLMGTMTNDTERAARYGGFYKTIQNAASAIAAQVDAINTPFMTQLIINFAIEGVGLLLAYIVCLRVPDVTVEQVDNLIDGHAQEIMVGGQVESIPDTVAYTRDEKTEDYY